MKKHLLLLALCTSLLLSGRLEAQHYKPARIFRHNQADIWMGYGMFPTYSKDATRISVPPVSLGADWMLSDQFSLGASAGYSLYQIEKLWKGDSTIRHYATHTLQIMGRAAAHYTRTDILDIFGGLQVGVQHVRIRSDEGPFSEIEALHGMKPNRLRLIYGAYLGVRFAVGRKSTILAEFGTGVSFAQVGYGVKMW
ncbi:MAG TPA: hypothetical protein PKB07_20420 [Flavilitoribacter sp.]|nr:hypothetical protein [Flavilitoribacter sp.]